MIKRLDSTFDPQEHGHANFPAMLQALAALVEVRQDEADLMVRLR
jgi:hypothetical protein